MKQFCMVAIGLTVASSGWADGVVDIDLGSLNPGTYSYTGTTVGGNSNIGNYTYNNLPIPPQVGWDQEFIYQFTTTERATIGLSSDDDNGEVSGVDNDFILTDTLTTTLNALNRPTINDVSLLASGGSFGLYEPGTYYLIVDAFQADNVFANPGPGAAGAFNFDLTIDALPVPALQAPVASYFFNNTLAANEPGAPALQALNHASANGFVTSSVPADFTAAAPTPESRTAYRFDGAVGAGNNAGLVLDPSGLLTDNGVYSVEMVVKFDDLQSDFVKVLSFNGDDDDAGIYIYPEGQSVALLATEAPASPDGGSNEFDGFQAVEDTYFHLVVSLERRTALNELGEEVELVDLANLYFNGTALDIPASPLTDTFGDFDLDVTNGILSFFNDDGVFGFNEVSDGSVAKIALYDQALSLEQAATLAQNPFSPVFGGPGVVGDYNDSGTVEQGDLDLVLNNWGTARPFDPNGEPFATTIVDQEELDRVLNNWGGSSLASFAGSAIPEPTAVAAMVGLGALGLRRRVA